VAHQYAAAHHWKSALF